MTYARNLIAKGVTVPRKQYLRTTAVIQAEHAVMDWCTSMLLALLFAPVRVKRKMLADVLCHEGFQYLICRQIQVRLYELVVGLLSGLIRLASEAAFAGRCIVRFVVASSDGNRISNLQSHSKVDPAQPLSVEAFSSEERNLAETSSRLNTTLYPLLQYWPIDQAVVQIC